MCFVAPALTATAISSERERGTYDILRVSLITPWQIVRGKLTAPLGYTFLLIFSTLPLLSLPLILGGIEIAEGPVACTGASPGALPRPLELRDVFRIGRVVVLACFEQTDFGARFGKFVSSHAAACAGAYNDDVVGFGCFFDLEISHDKKTCVYTEKNYAGTKQGFLSNFYAIGFEKLL